MGIGVYFSISSLIILSILTYIFFSKKRVDNIETRLYGRILLLTLFGLSLEIITCFWFVLGVSLDNIAYHFASKLTASYYMIWSSLFVNYLINICSIDKNLKKVFNLFNICCLIFILILPIVYETTKEGVLPTGPAIYLTYIVCLLYAMLDLIICLRYRKKISSQKFTPIYTLLGLGGIDIVLGVFFPSLFLIGYVYSLIVIIMYFTIENPDVKMIEQLNIAKDQADRANNAKTEFLSSMSHEIRTPLNAIDGFSQLILEEDNIDVIKDEAKDIMIASQNLLEIVNGILDISKIEADKLEIVNVEYEPSKVFDDLVKLIKARIGEKPLDFRVNIAKDLPDYLDGDYTRLKQIVLNLLTNAVKYTKEGFVEFNVSAVKKNKVCRLIISVKDSGIGIKKENISKLFTKFERFDKERNLTIEGTGLGLAITKKLVDLMHGNITVDSVYGKGSTFMVAIDQKIVDKKKVKVADAVVKKDNKINIKGKKVLIVDDNLINLKVADRLLLSYKLVTECVSSGFECIKKIEEGNKYDLILMDDMMPKMSGVETFNKLKKMDNFNVPVIALTANAIAGMKENYLKEGFNDYISKPIDKKELERVLKEFLK